MQKLENQLSDKKMEEFNRDIEAKNTLFDESKESIITKKKDLKVKKTELEKIAKETEKEETTWLKKSEKARRGVEERLVTAYKRIRSTYKNGLAVVTYERDACGGCFNKIPPQRQLEIRQRKKIIVCEHCGRILVDPVIAK